MQRIVLFFSSILLAAGLNLLPNPDFETPHVADSSLRVVMSSAVTGWSGKFYLLPSTSQKCFSMGQCINIIGNGNAYIEGQFICAVPSTYSLKFHGKSEVDLVTNLQISLNDILFSSLAIGTAAEQYSLEFNCSLGSEVIKFRNINQRDDLMVDEIIIEAVQINEPEIGIGNNSSGGNSNSSSASNMTYNDTHPQNQSNSNNNNQNPNQNVDNNSSSINNESSASNETAEDNSTIEEPSDAEAKSSTGSEVEGVEEKLKKMAKGIGKLPINQLGPLKYLAFILDDLWLYSYDKVEYHGVLEEIFMFIVEVEDQKWAFIDSFVGKFHQNTVLPVSNYTDFSNKKHYEIDGEDDYLIKNTLDFFVFSLPQNILLCLLLFAIFSLSFNYSFSIFFRRYSFLLACFLQTLLEGNIGYFTYLSFNHLKILFQFQFWDYFYSALSVTFFFVIVVFVFSFFYLISYNHQKQCGYFIYNFYRTFPAISFLIVKLSVRGFARGAIHHFCNSNYPLEMILLCTMESCIIVLAIVLEKRRIIFLCKLFFVFTVLYHFLFILLNLVLLLERLYPEMCKISDCVYQSIIYGMFGVIILIVIVDFLPLEWLKRKKRNNHGERQRESERKKKRKKRIQSKNKKIFSDKGQQVLIQVEQVTSNNLTGRSMQNYLNFLMSK